MLNAAKFGTKESVIGVSPSIYLGKVPPNVGTGTVNIIEEPFIPEEDVETGEVRERTEQNEQMIMLAEAILSGSTLEKDMEEASASAERGSKVVISSEERKASATATVSATTASAVELSSLRQPDTEILATPAKSTIDALQQAAESGLLYIPSQGPRKTENSISPVHPPKIITPKVNTIPPLPSLPTKPSVQPHPRPTTVQQPVYVPPTPTVPIPPLAPIATTTLVQPTTENYLSMFPTEEELRRGRATVRNVVPSMDTDAIRRQSQR
jgi:hypothetical protein